MGYTLRELKYDDFSSSVELGCYAFKVELTEEQKISRQDSFLSDNFTRYGVFEQNQLCSQLMLHHYECMIQGKPVKASGVASVSSWPEYRRNGYVAKLLEHSFVDMRQRGEIVSLLHPFSIAFYRKFGYETLSQRILNAMPIRYITRYSTGGSISRVKSYTALKPVYDQYKQQFNGLLARDDNHWEHYLPSKKKGVAALYYDEQQQKRGYMIYSIGAKFTILEFVALDKNAHQALWNFVAQHDSMAEYVEWYTPFADYTFSALQDPRIKREVEQYGMVRIVDCEAFFKGYRFAPSLLNETEYYDIVIQDQHAPWNDGKFQLSIQVNGEANLERVDKSSTQKLETISLSINVLSGLLFGYYTLDYLIWNNQISGDADILASFKKRLVASDVQLLDYF